MEENSDLVINLSIEDTSSDSDIKTRNLVRDKSNKSGLSDFSPELRQHNKLQELYEEALHSPAKLKLL
jgi:hypothetical protein